jgi:hypothetical protein
MMQRGFISDLLILELAKCSTALAAECYEMWKRDFLAPARRLYYNMMANSLTRGTVLC